MACHIWTKSLEGGGEPHCLEQQAYLPEETPGEEVRGALFWEERKFKGVARTVLSQWGGKGETTRSDAQSFRDLGVTNMTWTQSEKLARNGKLLRSFGMQNEKSNSYNWKDGLLADLWVNKERDWASRCRKTELMVNYGLEVRIWDETVDLSQR